MNHDDVPPDPRLRAALRHAPDADLQAPPRLRTQLLAAARDAVAPKTRWWQRWLSPSPLGASGAFATLLLAGVIGLLWRGEPPPAVVELAAPAPAPFVAAPAPEAPPAAAPAPRQQQAERQALADQGAATARKLQRSAEQTAAKAANAAAAEKAAAPERVAESSVGRLADAAVPPAAPPPPPPTPAPIAPAAAPPPVTAVPLAAAPALAEARRAPATRMAALAPAPRVRTDWLAAGVTWQIDGAASTPADDAWLRELLRLAEGRWQPTPPRTLAGARQLLLSSGDARLAVSLGEAEVLWCEAAAPCRAAPLSTDEARSLRDALQR
jgi:hypothetical protein